MIKTMVNLLKQDKEKFVVAKGVQDAIPIKAIYEDGIFKVGKDKYSKSYKFTDINYAVASKEVMFLEYSELLNSLDSGAITKIIIDKLIFSYYSKEEINNFKRKWRNHDLPSYMIRILIQSIQVYHRREYALTVATLSTLWEGIIQEKVQDNGYRVSKRTRQNFTKLIDENEYDKIFSYFFAKNLYFMIVIVQNKYVLMFLEDMV